MRELDFSDANLSGCDFREAVFIGGSLRDAHLAQARFDGADLREADMGGLKLEDARLFRGATISRHQAAGLLMELGITVE
ncbi:Pentapeptide repeats (8 copies) [compost metagenome]